MRDYKSILENGKAQKKLLAVLREHMYKVEDLEIDFLKNHRILYRPWKVSRCSQVYTSPSLKITALLSGVFFPEIDEEGFAL